MIDLYRNSNVYNRIAEGEIAEILSKFNTSYVMDVIDSNIKNRFAFNQSIANPNIVNSYELNFLGMINNFPNDNDNIMSIRKETYLTIINKICSSFNMQYIGDNPDEFTLAYILYNTFVSGFSRNIVTFFSKYIYTYRNEIYNNMGLDRYKRSKDSTTNYVKKVFDDTNLSVIIARIRDVIYYVSGFDIDMYTYLSFIYPKAECDFIYSNVAPFGNLFKDEICQVVNIPSILTEIRVAIQNLYIEEHNNDKQEEEQPEENNDGDEVDYE